MLIHCKLKRNGGTKIELFGQQYHFTPNDKGDHVCVVTEPQAQHRLTVQIPEAYEVYAHQPDGIAIPKTLSSLPAPSAAPVNETVPHLNPLLQGFTAEEIREAVLYLRRQRADAAAKADAESRYASLVGSSVQPSVFQFGDNTVQLGEIVAGAFEKFGLKVVDWNALSEEDRELLIAQEVARREAEANAKRSELQLGTAQACAGCGVITPGVHANDCPTLKVPAADAQPLKAAAEATLPPALQEGAGQGPLASQADSASSTAAETSPAKLPKVPKTMIIASADGSQSIDLMTLEYDAVKKLATETFGIQVHRKWSVQAIRDKIVEATRRSGQ